MLLACKNCNILKKDKVANRNDYYFPDEDNTSLLFTYAEGGIVNINDSLSSEEKELA